MILRHALSLFTWPRLVTLVRVVLAARVLALIAFAPERSSPLFFTVLAIFLGYAVAIAIYNRLQTGPLGLLALFADTVYFLMLAGFAADELPWLSTIFYLHLLAESITFFGPVEVALVVTVCSLFCLLVPVARSLPLARITIVGGAITFACSYGKRKLDRSIARLEAQLAEAQKGQEKALEDERKRIADDFHDGPLQSFINLQIRLDVLRKVLERDFARGLEDLRQLESLAQSQVRDLRAFLNGMRPVEVDGANLMASARRTAENFQKESGIPVTFVGANTPVGLPHEASSEVLQMLREALHNVRKHAGATRVAVAMDKTDRGLEVSVDDNGNGFAFSGTYTLEELELLRLGPASLKRRARALNADLLLESRPGRGAGLKFRIPL
jgi:signal transduction histidine kinase